MAIMQKHKQEKNYVEIPNKTAKAPEKKTPEQSISLQALGLIVNLWSYDIEKWELYKTELYKRFTNNKATSVTSAWAELVEAKYILEYKVRIGKKNDYIYFYNIVPFTETEIAEYNAQVLEEYGDFSALDFQDLKIRTSFSEPQNQELLNTKEKKDFKKEKINKKNIKLASLEDMNSVDALLKSIFPETPFDEIKNRMIEDAKKGEVLIDTKNRYQGFLNSRLEDWIRSKRPNRPYTRSNSSARKEILPDWFDEENEPSKPSETKQSLTDEELEAKRKEIKDMLDEFRNK